MVKTYGLVSGDRKSVVKQLITEEQEKQNEQDEQGEFVPASLDDYDLRPIANADIFAEMFLECWDLDCWLISLLTGKKGIRYVPREYLFGKRSTAKSELRNDRDHLGDSSKNLVLLDGQQLSNLPFFLGLPKPIDS